MIPLFDTNSKVMHQNEKDIYELRLDGIPESEEHSNFWKRSEHDCNIVQHILNFLEVECMTDNIKRIGKFDLNKNHRIVFQVRDLYSFKKLIATAKHLRQFDLKGIYLNRQPTGDEAKREAKHLMH